MTEQAKVQLLQDLHEESDLCRNEGATDIANLLDRAISALQSAAQDRKDAERYRWLRDNVSEAPYSTVRNPEIEDWRMKYVFPTLISMTDIRSEVTLDEAIDYKAATQPTIDSRKEVYSWPKPEPEDSTWTICPKFLQRIEDASGDEVEWMPSLEGIQAVLLALCRCDAPKEPQKMSDELRNVREVKVEGDFSVRLVFASCRSAEAFARAVRGEREEG